MIKIISKKQYDKLVRLLKEAYVIVTNLEAENKRLKRDLADLQNFCMNFAADQSKKSLDFPNSYKSYEDKNY